MEQNSGGNAAMDVFRGSMISENVGPSLQMESSLLHSAVFSFPPPCFLPSVR